MSAERKDDSIEFRIESARKARWLAKYEELEYGSLSEFIMDTIEAVHFSTDLPAAPPPPVADEQNAAQAPGAPVKVADGKAPTLAKGVCAAQAKHRKGIFCKTCRKVI